MNESDLQRIWSQVRRKHFYPELPDPVSVESVESGDSVDSNESNASSVADVALEIKSKRITLSESFVERLAPFLPPETVVEALLDHPDEVV